MSNSTNNQIDFLSSSNVAIGYSKVAGRGVFAVRDINEGEIVERCPMVRLGYRSNYIHDPVIWQYCYTQPKCDCADCKNHGFYVWMVLGYGMIYNHQDIPNTKWMFNYNSSYADVVASKPIKRGDEIYVSYGTNYFKNRPKITLDEQPTVKSVIKNSEAELEDDESFMKKIEELMKSAQSK